MVSNERENTRAEDGVFLCCLVNTGQIVKEWLMFPIYVFALNPGYLCALLMLALIYSAVNVCGGTLLFPSLAHVMAGRLLS